MISYQYKYIFIENSKSGGSSIENLLRHDKPKGADHHFFHEYSNYLGFDSDFKFHK